jgi:exodeoxyribonuclease V alpha subunit
VETLTGAIERFVFHQPETAFTVARLRLDASSGTPAEALVTVVGTLPGIQVGESLTLEGSWAVHQRHGREFRVVRFEPRVPVSIDGLRRYLGSGLIRGVGPALAARIVDCFGEATLQVIEASPERLATVPGISAKRIESISRAWAEQGAIKTLMLFLQSHGVAAGLAVRIFRAYGAEALTVVRTDPYRLVRDVRGIGFRTADDLALQLGLPRDSAPRYAAGLRHVLSLATNEGQTYLPRTELLDRGAALLETAPTALADALERLQVSDEVIVEDAAVYLIPLFLAERHAARRLMALAGPSPLLLGEIPPDPLPRDSDQGPVLSEAQRAAVALALREKVCVLTGGPGVGKSTTVRGLIRVLSAHGVRFCLAAPTGRAARRLAEATGHPAHTIHRLLQFSPTENRFTMNDERPLPYQYVVADEASMLDIVLFYNLLKALRPQAHLLLVGDADQLPSVGPGNVLRDIIASGTVPVVELRELFRQAQASRIVQAAYQINAGLVPDLANRADSDLFFLPGDAGTAAALICALVATRLPARYGFDALRDIQVITPMHRGLLGVAALNAQLQAQLNPGAASKGEVTSAGRIFRLGDKVMQLRNDYDRGVFNGEMGLITAIDGEDGVVEVRFAGDAGEDVRVHYDLLALDDLVHAYAISVHKAQGSEFPCVVLVLTTQHRLLLQRNLLYTALTRARKLCVLVGSRVAVHLAVQNVRTAERYSQLACRLRAEVGQG